ncbi:hypothetical protein ABN028_29940 [Actinopolymorpha sp. B17G11]|uniref:hypothetical protein n=1 Tax=Actinopolymorpha sp. B17G11 TaxID=3160861 RepID=UPI0032E3EC5F
MQWEHIQAEVRRARQSRFEQTVTQRDLVDSVSQILFRADPVGINFETNTDEYDAEAETIVIGLPNTHGPEDVNALTHETFVQWFDAQTAGPIERYAAVSSEIWNLWRRHHGQHGLSGQ